KLSLYTLFITHLFKFCVLIGCTLENTEKTVKITAHRGGSVLLPCYCTDLRSKPERLIWNKHNRTTNQLDIISSESYGYRKRIQLFNHLSPANLSLLISHLTEEDAGDYWCDVENDKYVFIKLKIEGCTLVNSGRALRITAYTGESVLLPCSCTDLNSTPDTFTWKKYNTISNRYEEISSESDQYRNRVQLFNNLSPANLSLLISHLTEEDDGFYRCHLTGNELADIRLFVPTKLTPTSVANCTTNLSPSVTATSKTEPTVKTEHSTLTPFKGCFLTNSGEALRITAHKGESVLLPCSCTDLHSTPDTFSWSKLKNRYTWEEISSESDQYRNRVQLFNNLSPANLSLLISHLTEEDDGDYSCFVRQSGFRHIRLTVKGKTLFNYYYYWNEIHPVLKSD
ncbi:polymeric immunoglobulin receptor-like isoform X1, partial [Astyanax mexicanus]